MRLGPQGAVTGWASLLQHGALGFDGLGPDGRTILPVMLVSPDRQLRGRVSSHVLLDRLDDWERIVVDGVPCTDVRRALFDLMRHQDLREAVVSMDAAAHVELTSIRRMYGYVLTRARWNGLPLVEEALGLADEHSRSQAETRMRLVWVIDAGLPRPLCNRPIFSLSGELLGVPDLLDVEAGVVGEYDGADHRRRDRRFRDLGRETLFRGHGLEYFTLVAGDLQDRDRAVARMIATRERALRSTDFREQTWTLRPPPGWHGFRDDIPLDDRLDLRDLMRDAGAR